MRCIQKIALSYEYLGLLDLALQSNSSNYLVLIPHSQLGKFCWRVALLGISVLSEVPQTCSTFQTLRTQQMWNVSLGLWIHMLVCHAQRTSSSRSLLHGLPLGCSALWSVGNCWHSLPAVSIHETPIGRCWSQPSPMVHSVCHVGREVSFIGWVSSTGICCMPWCILWCALLCLVSICILGLWVGSSPPVHGQCVSPWWMCVLGWWDY